MSAYIRALYRDRRYTDIRNQCATDILGALKKHRVLNGLETRKALLHEDYLSLEIDAAIGLLETCDELLVELTDEGEVWL